MSKSTKISIVIAGHTNIGKTTLIRTFMKTSVGKVGDCANVTKKGESYQYDGLQAHFIDTPGFRYAVIYNMYLDEFEKDPTYKMPRKWQQKIDLDLDAIQAIKRSTAAIYVGNLSIVPDESHEEEMNVVQKLQPKVIAILNQYHKQLKASSQGEVEHRIDLWKQALSSCNIDDVVVFDAHWDKYSKVNQIYENIHQVLDQEEKHIFHQGLTAFKERQKEIRKEACSMLANFVAKLQQIKITEQKSTYSEEQVMKQIDEIIRDFTMGFTKNVNALYKVAAEYPTETSKELKIRLKSDPNLLARLSSGAGAATILGGGGAAIGAAIGGLLAGIISGGLGAGAGAVLGAQIGTAICGGLGSLAVLSDDNDTITVTLVSKQIEELVIKCLSIIWGLFINGYGRGRKLTGDEVKEIEQQIKDMTGSSTSLDWMSVRSNIIIDYCERILEELENKW